jgi:8-oxo-dGTP pyrophosphatase MutT (NUDIX family)
MLSAHLQDLLNEDRIRKIVGSFKPTALEDATLRPAAVLVPLLPTDAGPSVVLTVRTHRVEHHKGEISFPGGARDPGDITFLATALREAQEEVGLRPEDVEVLGQLDDIQTTSGFLVQAFVGLIPPDYAFRPRAWEVAEVLIVPVAHLLDPAHTTLDQRLYRVTKCFCNLFGETNSNFFSIMLNIT